MSEYLSKKAVLEWLDSEMSINKGHPDDIDIHWTLNRVSKKILSGALDADESEGTWKATAEVLGRENAQMNSEVQRLRALLERLDSYIDFSEHLSPGDWGIEDVTGINSLFDEVREALDAAKVERVREGDGNDA